MNKGETTLCNVALKIYAARENHYVRLRIDKNIFYC
jgi:hypothetical protein